MTVALYVLVALAPLVSIALTSAAGVGFAVSFSVLALVVLNLVELATAPDRTGPCTQPDHRRSP